MKKILSFMLVLSLALMATAQIQDPVKWSFSVKDLNENESELVFTAQLDQGWHLYSQHTDPNGPFPIAFEFTPSSDYKRIGGVSEPKPHEEFDKDFNCTYEYIFIDDRPATEEEVRNYNSFESFSLLKTPNGTAKYNYKDKKGIICFTTYKVSINKDGKGNPLRD